MMKILLLRAPHEAWENDPLRDATRDLIGRAVEQLNDGEGLALVLPPGWSWEVVEVDRIVMGENHAECEPDGPAAGSP